ncbi:MAG: hypothetical protein ACOYOA_13545 [Saprospiraceae bacterium]
MKKNIFNLLISVTAIIFAGCNKVDYTDISGRVIEKGSKKGVADAQVVFYQCISGRIGQGSFCEPIDTVLTDPNGNYHYVLENDKTVNYHIEAYKPNYTMQTLQSATGGEKTKNVDILMRAHAWIRFHVKNVNPFDDNDLIYAPGQGGLKNYQFYGKQVDSIYVLDGYTGNQKNTVFYTVVRNSIVKQYVDTVYCKPLDTVFYELKY